MIEYQGLKMKNILLTLLVTLTLSTAWAGPEEDAIAAYSRRDYAAVLKIVRPPAIKGEAWAQSWLAEANESGEGVVQDYAEAVKWYRLAAQQGHATAQNNLGLMYVKSQGVVQDYVEAVKWYRLAAQQGRASAQFDLGAMYAIGQGVMQDYVKAHVWFNLAAASGHEGSVKARDLTTKMLTPQQIGDAQKLARDCQAKKLKGCD